MLISDITPLLVAYDTVNLSNKLSAYDKAVTLTLTWMPGILPYAERPELSLKQAALGGSDKDTEREPQPPP